MVAPPIDNGAFACCMVAVVGGFASFLAGDRLSAILLMLVAHLTVKGIRP